MNLFVAFLTGLTTGGLSCLAVQGGLLASSMAAQVEQNLQSQRRKLFQPQIAQPIALFLLAKLVAYTLFGALLGGLGSILDLNPITRAVLMIAIGIFMIGNGLRMLKVHPIFRYFVIEPPSALTRYIRRTSKASPTAVTTMFLGALTILIPCGVAQAMMAVALGTRSPLQGAAILFAFTLGTTPVFFSIAYFATRLGATVEKYFMRIVAVTVLVLGLVSIDAGLNLAGSPYSFTNLAAGLGLGGAALPGATPDPTIHVSDNGYSPKVLHLAAGKPVSLQLITQNTQSCAISIVIPDLNYQKVLQSTGQETVRIPPQPKGSVMRYSCSMGMYTGQLIFDLD